MFSGFFSYTTPRKEGVAVEKRMARESDQDSDVGERCEKLSVFCSEKTRFW